MLTYTDRHPLCSTEIEFVFLPSAGHPMGSSVEPAVGVSVESYYHAADAVAQFDSLPEFIGKFPWAIGSLRLIATQGNNGRPAVIRCSQFFAVDGEEVFLGSGLSQSRKLLASVEL